MTTNHDPQLEQGSTELCTTASPPAPASTRPDRTPGMHWSWRTDKRVLWVGYQSPELAGVLGPVMLVVFFHWSWTWLGMSMLVAAAWAGHELRRRRRGGNSRGGPRPGALTTDQADGTQAATDDEEASRGQFLA